MQDAHSQGYKVGIVMHIPAGVSYIGTTQGWPTEYLNRFNNICKSNNIFFTLASHAHSDILMPVFGDDGALKGYSLSHSNNPARRLMKYDENGIRDIHRYHTNVLMNPTRQADVAARVRVRQFLFSTGAVGRYRVQKFEWLSVVGRVSGLRR
jgi:hypothetical protein